MGGAACARLACSRWPLRNPAALNPELPWDVQGAKRAAGPGAPLLLSAELAAQPSVLLLTTAAPGPSCSASTWGQLLVIGWSVTLCVIIVRTRVLPRWLGVTGPAVSALYLLNQGDILATAVPGFPVWDPAGPIGSTGWGVWVAALGVTILLRPATRPATAGPRS